MEFMHALHKLAQTKNIFVCDLVAIIKVYQNDIYNMYCDPTSNFIIENFWAFKSFLEFKHESIHM
jgi:hypothetical protein